jgi:2-C-methyl-D-erythritol 4-phosphate cytidylyltransferase
VNGTAGDVVALVPAAGKGLRLGHDEPKAFVCLGTDSLLTRSVDGLRASGAVDRIVVIVPVDLLDAARGLVGDDVTVVASEALRSCSSTTPLALSPRPR